MKLISAPSSLAIRYNLRTFPIPVSVQVSVVMATKSVVSFLSLAISFASLIVIAARNALQEAGVVSFLEDRCLFMLGIPISRSALTSEGGGMVSPYLVILVIPFWVWSVLAFCNASGYVSPFFTEASSLTAMDGM